MREKKVSIIIPVYNATPFLEATLRSVLAQTYQPLEIICVNDGSKDKSLTVLLKYENELTVIDQENSGAAAARNRGLHEASGDFIKFWDADDLMNPKHIEAQVAALNGYPNCVASCRWGRFYDADPKSTRFIPETVWEDLDSLDWIKKSLSQRVDMASSWLWLIPKDIMELAGGWNSSLSLNDDFEFSMRILKHAKKVRFANDAVTYYRSGNAGSLASVKSRKAFETALESTAIGCNHILEMENSCEVRQLIANRFQEWVFRMYPHYPELVRETEEKIRQLGGSTNQIEGGRVFQLLTRLIGWKLTKRFQFFTYAMGYRPKHPHLSE